MHRGVCASSTDDVALDIDAPPTGTQLKAVSSVNGTFWIDKCCAVFQVALKKELSLSVLCDA